MEIISREEAYRRGLVRYFTGKPCGKGHVGERYVSTGGCVACLRPYKRSRNAFDKRAVPFVPQFLWVRSDYNDAERQGLNAYLQQCIDAYDRNVRPNDAPLMYSKPPEPEVTPTSAPNAQQLESFAELPSAQRGPGRPVKCEPHGIEKGFCSICDEE